MELAVDLVEAELPGQVQPAQVTEAMLAQLLDKPEQHGVAGGHDYDELMAMAALGTGEMGGDRARGKKEPCQGCPWCRRGSYRAPGGLGWTTTAIARTWTARAGSAAPWLLLRGRKEKAATWAGLGSCRT